VTLRNKFANGSPMVVLIKKVIANFFSPSVAVSQKELLRAFIGTSLGLLVAAMLSRWALGGHAVVMWLVAPMGATAIIIFALPSSPLAQPWPVLCGHAASAFAGVTCAITIPDPAIAATVAGAGAMMLMFLLRCLHPPGGATALLAVILHITSYQYIVFPVLVNAALLVLVGVFFNNATGRPYPHRTKSANPAASENGRFSSADLDVALARYNQILDVSKEDLTELLHHAELAAYQRNLGNLRCAGIMSPKPLTVKLDTSLDAAWRLMRQHSIKALPVTDDAQHILGIITVADFMRQIDADEHSELDENLQNLLQRSESDISDQSIVRQIMMKQVQTIHQNKFVIELVPLFSQAGHRHIPVTDSQNKLVGIITQSDLIRALYRAVSA
jgi:CBS domain-containing membrane protein